MTLFDLTANFFLAQFAPIFTLNQGNNGQKIQGSWKIIPNELFVFTPENIEHREKIAGFDLGFIY